MSIFAVLRMKLVFGVPLRGKLPLVLSGAALCVLSGISIGTVNATFSKSAQQAQLTTFFINPPLNSTAGALNPVQAMPAWLQPVRGINPVRPVAVITRPDMLSGRSLAHPRPY